MRPSRVHTLLGTFAFIFAVINSPLDTWANSSKKPLCCASGEGYFCPIQADSENSSFESTHSVFPRLPGHHSVCWLKFSFNVDWYKYVIGVFLNVTTSVGPTCYEAGQGPQCAWLPGAEGGTGPGCYGPFRCSCFICGFYPETLERVHVLHLGDNHGNEPEGPPSALLPTPITAGKNSHPTMAWSCFFSTAYEGESSITVHKL